MLLINGTIAKSHDTITTCFLTKFIRFPCASRDLRKIKSARNQIIRSRSVKLILTFSLNCITGVQSKYFYVNMKHLLTVYFHFFFLLTFKFHFNLQHLLIVNKQLSSSTDFIFCRSKHLFLLGRNISQILHLQIF